MIGGEIVGNAMAIDHLCTCAWQFNVIHRLDRFWAGVARCEERRVVYV